MRSAISLLLLVSSTASLVAGQGCTRAEFASKGEDAAVTPGADVAPVKDGQSREPLVCSATPVAECSSRWSPCDPVCQTGSCPDWCDHKCSFAYGTGTQPQIACVSDPGGKHVFPEPCTVEHSGTGEQTDDCAGGHICLPTFKGEKATLCFRLCHDSTECIAGDCAPRALSSIGGTVSVCDPPSIQCGEATKPCCDPLTNAGCDSNQYCFLTTPDDGTNHSRTLCDYSYGDGRGGDACTSSRDCQRLYTCVGGACRQVCTDDGSCPSGSCARRGSEYGYCP